MLREFISEIFFQIYIKILSFQKLKIHFDHNLFYLFNSEYITLYYKLTEVFAYSIQQNIYMIGYDLESNN